MYRLKPEQQAIVERAKRIAAEEIAPHAERVDAEGMFPRNAIEALAREGFLGLTVAPEFGGMSQGLRVMCAVLDEVSQACASTGMVYLMHLCGIACYVSQAERTGDYLKAAARGEHLSTLAWSESGSRSHFWAPISRAMADNGSVRVSARKSFVTSAGYADGYVVSTQWIQAQSPTDTMLYLVLKDDPGLSVDGAWQALGMRGNASAPMKLEEVTLDEERALSPEGKGFEVMLQVVLPVFQLGNAAISVGISEAAVQATQKHLTTSRFEHLGTRLADLPNQRARLAEMRLRTDCSRAHLASAIDSVEDPGPTTMLMVLEAKAAASETAAVVTEIGMRACGGAAFGGLLGLERYFRDARASAVMAPTTDHVYDFIGRALCGMELFG